MLVAKSSHSVEVNALTGGQSKIISATLLLMEVSTLMFFLNFFKILSSNIKFSHDLIDQFFA